jgi:single-stranded-DNA-specific exonuclease
LLESIGYQKIDSTAVSFGLAPRINACGRMGHADEALKLFLTNSIEEAKQITENLNNYNQERQDIEKKIFADAQEMMQSEEEQKLPCIVLGKENWHHGVIGIVSSKITDMYSKPSILLCFEEENMARGSGRSVPGFDLHEALEKCSSNIKQFGGHSMAVGLTVEQDKFKDFKNELEEYAKEMKVDSLVSIIKINQKVDLPNITIQDIKDLELLEPYGEANKMPIFQMSNLRIYAIRTLSEGKHLKLALRDENTIINAIGFNLGHLADEYRIGDKINIAGVLEINKYNGVENIQINIKDVRRSI